MSCRRVHHVGWVALWIVLPAVVLANGVDLANRPVADIRFEGLNKVPEQLVLNQVRLTRGGPYDPAIVEQDIVRLTHLGRFSSVAARVEPQADGSVVVTYVLVEQALLADVQVVGNKKKSDQELLGRVILRAGDAIDRFLIDKGKREIQRAYEEDGYFLTEVNVDEELLKESSILIYRIVEGPRPRIRGIQFDGNTVFTEKELRSKIRSNTKIFIFRRGEMNREQLDADAARVRDFYRERGYLDAQVGRRIDLSPNQKDAVIVFFVEEGRQYIVADISVEGNEIFSAAQVLEVMTLRIGDVFSADRLRSSQEAVRDLYGSIGFISVKATLDRRFHEHEPMVDVMVRIDEGISAVVGKVSVRGNQVTKENVILRQMQRVEPNRRFDGPALAAAERRLTASALFEEAKVVVLGDPQDEVRDVLVEVKEKNTGSLSFGAGISSDAGVVGAIDLTQRNFDITDTPESLHEFITGKAFRGAGQYFALTLQPGNRFSTYSTTFREPYLFESRYFLDTTAFFFTRQREDWDEQRIGGRVGIGQRFGNVWSGMVSAGFEQIEIDDIDKSAPVDVFDVEGESVLTTLTFQLTRTTTNHRFLPWKGSNIQATITQGGALGGDYDFTRITGEVSKFWSVEEDFYGRHTTISAHVEAGYIFDHGDDTPLFERFYAGGHRSFRGFDYRGVGPRGIRNDTGRLGDDPVGGLWLFLLRVQYDTPVWKDVLRWVLFMDSGTVQEDIGFDEYRVSFGTGIRLKVPIFGDAPFAFDIAYPVLKQDGDDVQYFSFDLALPF